MKDYAKQMVEQKLHQITRGLHKVHILIRYHDQWNALNDPLNEIGCIEFINGMWYYIEWEKYLEWNEDIY